MHVQIHVKVFSGSWHACPDARQYTLAGNSKAGLKKCRAHGLTHVRRIRTLSSSRQGASLHNPTPLPGPLSVVPLLWPRSGYEGRWPYQPQILKPEYPKAGLGPGSVLRFRGTKLEPTLFCNGLSVQLAECDASRRSRSGPSNTSSLKPNSQVLRVPKGGFGSRGCRFRAPS